MEKVELSQIQKQFWILQHLYKDTAAYNSPVVFVIKGEINLEAFEDAVNQVVVRHDMLRTQFVEENNLVYQYVNNNSPAPIRIERINIHDEYYEGSLPTEILKEVHKVFDLKTWPLFRIRIFAFNNVSVLTIVFHHIIQDHFSVQTFTKELSDLYNSSYRKTHVELKPPSNNYLKYAAGLERWLSGESAEKKIEEWQKDIPAKPEKLELPTTFPRPRVNSLEGRREHFTLESVSAHEISEFARKHRVSELILLLSAYAVLLNRLSNQKQVIIGVPFANRKNPEYSTTFGCFVNTLPLLVDFSGDIKGQELLKQVFKSLLRIYSKEEVPSVLINSLLGHGDGSSLYQAGFTFEPRFQMPLEGLEVIPQVVERDGTQLDLFFSLYENNDHYNAYIQYSTLIFSKEIIGEFWSIYCTIVKSFINEPELLVGDINITPEKDISFILNLNDTDAEYEKDICIHQKFEEQVERTPDAPALLFDNQLLTYREFDNHANRMANAIISKEIRVEDIVCLCVDRGVEMMIGIFGILKAGAAYLPINPQTPAERINSIITDASPRLILTTRSYSENIPRGIPMLYLDDILSNPLSDNISVPEVNVTSKNLAYIIYTSGSTGMPKGVMIEHHSVMNRLGWMQKAYPIDESDTLLQKTPVTFDVSVWELFWWSFNGARLALLPRGGEKDPETIVQHIERHNVTTIHFVPSMFTAFLETLKSRKAFSKLHSLNRIFMSGEALPVKLVSEFNEMRYDYNLPSVINLYGPTEATVDVSFYNCPESNVKNVFIGRPIDNTKLIVLNDKKRIQPIGVPGELIITGVNLARGYLNHPELTNERFFDFKLSDDCVVKAYLTGDLVKLTPEGELDYIGRLDNQVKIRGFRIELGDVEAKIHEYPHVQNCAVIVSDDSEFKSLIAYVCLKPGIKAEEIALRKFLSAKLPDYMVPSFFVFLDTLPLTASGKLNRKTLPKPEKKSSEDTVVLPANNFETGLLGIWSDLLKIENISVRDNFFDIGGNSLLAITLATRISDEFNMVFNTITVLEYPNIRDQSDYIAGEKNLVAPLKELDVEEKMQRRKSVDFQKRRLD